MRTFRLTDFGFAFFCVGLFSCLILPNTIFLPSATAAGRPATQNQANKVQMGYCQASSSDQGTIYFSDIFKTDLPYSVIAGGGVENLFGAQLKQSYEYNSSPVTPVVCEYAQSAAAAEANKKQRQERYSMMGKQVVETRWKLSRQQAAGLSAPKNDCYYGHGEYGPCETAPAARPKTVYEVCRLQAVGAPKLTGGKYTSYISGVMLRGNVNDADYSAAFSAFLVKKYGIPEITPECISIPSGSEAEVQKFIETQWMDRPQYVTYVQTGWIYSAASTASPAAPDTPAPNATTRPGPHAAAASVAPALPAKSVPLAATPATPAAAASRYGLCYASSDLHTVYFSAPFKVADGNYSAWQQAFGTYLQQKYHYGAAIGCYRENSLVQAQSDMKSLEDSFRTNRKIVETGWEYK
jgi:hypothetical protein